MSCWLKEFDPSITVARWFNKQANWYRESTFNDRDLYRGDYLSLLSADTQSLSFNPRPSYSIRWTSAVPSAQAKHLRPAYRSFTQPNEAS
jgi:hypothetical protein